MALPFVFKASGKSGVVAREAFRGCCGCVMLTMRDCVGCDCAELVSLRIILLPLSSHTCCCPSAECACRPPPPNALPHAQYLSPKHVVLVPLASTLLALWVVPDWLLLEQRRPPAWLVAGSAVAAALNLALLSRRTLRRDKLAAAAAAAAGAAAERHGDVALAPGGDADTHADCGPEAAGATDPLRAGGRCLWCVVRAPVVLPHLAVAVRFELQCVRPRPGPGAMRFFVLRVLPYPLTLAYPGTTQAAPCTALSRTSWSPRRKGSPASSFPSSSSSAGRSACRTTRKAPRCRRPSACPSRPTRRSFSSAARATAAAARPRCPPSCSRASRPWSGLGDAMRVTRAHRAAGSAHGCI